MKLSYFLLAFSWTLCFTTHVGGARILGLFPLPGKSHFIMFQEVMKVLADVGHQVDVIGHFPRKEPYANYTDIVNLAGSIRTIVNNLKYDELVHFSGSSLKSVVYAAGHEVCGLLELPNIKKFIQNPPTDPPYDLVITEHFYASCYFAFGRHLKAPVVALSSGSVVVHGNAPLGNPLNPAIVSEIIERPATSMTFWQRFKNTIAIISMNLEAWYYLKEQDLMVEKAFGPGMPGIEELEGDISLLLTNSHPIFHGVRPLTPAVVEVAGLHVHDDDTPISADLKKWLDDSKDGFFYFSFGSLAMVESFPKSLLVEIYTAFAKIAPVRILMKISDPKLLPPGLSANVKTLTWAPQVQILKHRNIRGFITHGGMMGLQEAVTWGVPLIGIPLFGDQMGNIDILVDRGIAIYLDYTKLKTDELFEAMKAFIRDPKYKKNVQAISEQFLDQPLKPRDAVVFWIEYILKHGPDSLRSPAVKLSWWQLELLDIYGSILAGVAIVFYVLKVLLSATISRIFSAKSTSPSSKKKN